MEDGLKDSLMAICERDWQGQAKRFANLSPEVQDLLQMVHKMSWIDGFRRCNANMGTFVSGLLQQVGR